MLSEEGDIADAANIVSVPSKKQILEASIFEGGNKDLAAVKLLTTSTLPDRRWLRTCHSVLFGSLGCLQPYASGAESSETTSSRRYQGAMTAASQPHI